MKRLNITSKAMKSVSNKPTFILLIFVNAILLTAAFLLYGLYMSAYQESLWQENIANISNLNHAAATNATSLITNWNVKLDDISRNIAIHDTTYEEALALISDTNSSETRFFKLLKSDFTGHLAKKNTDGTFTELSYANYNAEFLNALKDTNDDYSEICFTPEFTDNGETAMKFFAIYKHIPIKNEVGEYETHTLLLSTYSSLVLEKISSQNSYNGQSTVLIDADGNYIVSNSDFKSTNFFQYLYLYNDLTLDEKNAIKEDVQRNGSGQLFYKNSSAVVEDCIFYYEKMDTNNWYCVTCVPISSFRTPIFNAYYVVYAVIMIVLLLVVDVSWLQSVNRRLRISIAHEIEANAAKGNFMSRMSHEIRTPLNAIIGYNTIAKTEVSEVKKESDHIKTKSKVLDCLNKSSIASKHLLTIINDVLDMSAIESGKIKVAHERFDFKGLINSLTTIFYSQAKAKDIEFEVVFDTLTEELFIGDQMRTNQILTNLLSNAIKFTPSGGNVRLKISQPQAQTNASYICFEIEDTGIGMSQEYLGHIWTPFEQADSSILRQFGGTGLGLSITKNLVELMDGSISVKSELGVGTTFVVELTFERTEQPEKNSPYDFSEINALVVDDDSYTCEYISQLFKRCGAKCTAVTSGAEAIEVFSASQHSTPFTVFLVDWQMPEMNGVETIKRLRKLVGENVPIIIITAYDFSEITEEAAKVGVNMYISKPLFQSSLFDVLATICGKPVMKKSEEKYVQNFDGLRILLAEDNMMNMEIAKKILETAGFSVDSAWNGQEAVDIFKKAPPDTYDAILMDIHMPVMDGHSATRTIRALSHPRASSIPIIAMTADAFAENVSEAHEAGMNDHVSKPIDVQILFEVLKKHIKK